jgi:hypothetical protein
MLTSDKQNMLTSDKYSLWGEFVIIKSFAPGISGMTETETKLWIGKKIEFHDSIYMKIDEKSEYKTLFKYTQCPIKKNYSVNKYSLDEFFRNYKFYPKEIGIIEKYVKYIIIENCSGTPFSQIIIKSNGNLIIGWDGVNFELTRLKR